MDDHIRGPCPFVRDLFPGRLRIARLGRTCSISRLGGTVWPWKKGEHPEGAGPKSYLYVSDAKVDMLIEGLGESVASRLDLRGTVGVPGVAGLEVSPRDRNRGRFARAEHLCAELDSRGLVGEVLDSGSRFFRGEMMMTWGFWNRRHGGYADVVFFSGFADRKAFVGLGGSAYHTLERHGDRLQEFSNSGLQQLMAFMRERAGDALDGRTGPPGAWNAESFDADHDNPLVPERVEFVAERLLDDTYEFGGVRTIIGSPIYVARSAAPASRRELKDYDRLREREMVDLYDRPRLEPFHPGSRWQVGSPSAPQLPPDLNAQFAEPDPT